MMDVVSIYRKISPEGYSFDTKAGIKVKIDNNKSRKVFNYITTNIEEIREEAKKFLSEDNTNLKTL